MVLNVPCSWSIQPWFQGLASGGRVMVFRTAGAIAALLIGLGGGHALAQYYPAPPLVYPPPQAYPPGYRPLPPIAEADDPLPLNGPPIVETRPLPPAPVGPQVNDPPPPPGYQRGAP